MTVLERSLVWGIGCAVLCTGGKTLFATSADNPYQPIVVRNVFSLKPKPEEKPPEPPKPPAPKITLNGITDLFGYPQALLTVQMPAKPGEPAKAQSFILKAGERDGELEVIQIDMAAGSVKVNNFNNEMTLTMEKDGAKPSGAPGAPPTPIAYTPPPNPYASAGPAPTPGNGLATLPTRILRTTPAGATGSPSPYGAGLGTAGGATLPGFSFGTPQGNGSVLVPPGADMSLEEKEALTELNYQQAKDAGHATAALFPPSRIDPNRNLATQPDPNAVDNSQIPANSGRRVRATGP